MHSIRLQTGLLLTRLKQWQATEQLECEIALKFHYVIEPPVIVYFVFTRFSLLYVLLYQAWDKYTAYFSHNRRPKKLL